MAKQSVSGCLTSTDGWTKWGKRLLIKMLRIYKKNIFQGRHLSIYSILTRDFMHAWIILHFFSFFCCWKPFFCATMKTPETPLGSGGGLTTMFSATPPPIGAPIWPPSFLVALNRSAGPPGSNRWPGPVRNRSALDLNRSWSPTENRCGPESKVF